jgi:hypothetical protein
MKAKTHDLCLAGHMQNTLQTYAKNGSSHVLSVKHSARDLAFDLLATGAGIEQVCDLIHGSFENDSQTKADPRSS